MSFERYWQRHGKRRPFPSLYEAMKQFGEDSYIRVSESPEMILKLIERSENDNS